LASASPRRKELLSLLQIEFKIVVSDIDETIKSGERAVAYVERLAREKASHVGRSNPEAVILAADTSVIVDDEILGKPGPDVEMGTAMLRKMSGRAHQVMTAIAVSHLQRVESRVVATQVHFRTMSDNEISWYVSSQEGQDKAGGYALQGRGSIFIDRIEGSSTNVIGLPLVETSRMLQQFGISLPWDLALKT